MNIKVFVEGGGETKALRTKCRRGFSNFFRKAGLEGRMPSVVASGSRRDAFNDFRAAVRNPGKYDFIMLLVDSEDPIAARSGPWAHLKKTPDNWDQPSGATDDQVHLMVQCMEAWFLADKDTLVTYYGNNFKQNALPARQDIENIAKNDVLKGLKNATSGVSKGEYEKGQHSFDILAQIDPDKVIAALPHAKRLVDTLKAKIG